MAGKPKYRVVAKSKSSGKFQDIAAFWVGEKGVSGQLDRSVAKIVLTSGAVITPDGCWFNLQLNEDHASDQQTGGSSGHESQDTVDDIPF